MKPASGLRARRPSASGLGFLIAAAAVLVALAGAARHGVGVQPPATEPADAEGRYALGLALSRGAGGARDDAAAVRWLRLAAEEGHAPAQNLLGLMIENGRGAAASDAIAAHWYRRAAVAGSLRAKDNLDWLYSHGRVLHDDPDEARVWYRKRSFR